jgi:hypothetical protein
MRKIDSKRSAFGGYVLLIFGLVLITLGVVRNCENKHRVSAVIERAK